MGSQPKVVWFFATFNRFPDCQEVRTTTGYAEFWNFSTGCASGRGDAARDQDLLQQNASGSLSDCARSFSQDRSAGDWHHPWFPEDLVQLGRRIIASPFVLTCDVQMPHAQDGFCRKARAWLCSPSLQAVVAFEDGSRNAILHHT